MARQGRFPLAKMAYLVYYLRMRKLWFRAKEYGWGWFPITWQGWAVTLLYSLAFAVSIILFASWLGDTVPGSGPGDRNLFLAIVEFLAWLALLTASLLRICYQKGEKPSWNWGFKKK